MNDKEPKLLQIWNQKVIPVLYRPRKGSPLLLRLPYAKDNRVWIKNKGKTEPEWLKNKGCWQLPKSWFERIIKQALL